MQMGLPSVISMTPASSHLHLVLQAACLQGFIKYSLIADADTYLLDDPLSAVDSHVGQHLFQQCLCEHLASKTKILVTHQLQFLPAADKIVILSHGQITQTGTYSELLDAGIEFK